MKRLLCLSAFLCVILILNLNLAVSQEKVESRFSPKGFKVAFGTGSYEVTSERALEEGDGGFLAFGYGFSERFTLWLALTGAEHAQIAPGEVGGPKMEFAGAEVNLQHRFESKSRFQPYGKVGVGVYGLKEHGSDIGLIGAGINLGLGLDFFFAKHFGVGIEAMYKKLDYFKESVSTPDGDLISDVRPQLNGDTLGFFLTFTIQ